MAKKPLPDTSESHAIMMQLETVRHDLMSIKTLPEWKQGLNRLEKLGNYVKQRQYGLEVQNEAAEIRLITERHIGAMLKEMKLKGGDQKSKLHDVTSILGKLGISKIQSHRWQREALLPDDAFQAYVTETKAKGEELTSAAVLREAKKYLPPPKPREKSWQVERDIDALVALWERLSPHWEEQWDRIRIYYALRDLLKQIVPEEYPTTRIEITPPFSDA